MKIRNLYIALGLACVMLPALTSCHHRHRRGGDEVEMTDGEQRKQAPLKVKFYIERSGSMTPYDSQAGDGSFKAAVVDMMNSVDTKHSALYVVNDGIHAYPKGIDQFIADNNIFVSTKGIGDPSYTDFRKIFDTILHKTNGDEVSVLVTDLIYSTKDMASTNPQKIFADAQGMIVSVFKGDVKQKSMVIAQMTGSYNGMYYPYNSPTQGKSYDGRRPYYIILVGSNHSIDRLTHDPAYRKLLSFTSKTGFQHVSTFTAGNVFHPYYSFILNGADNLGRYSAERGQGEQIVSIDDIQADRDQKLSQMSLAVDLTGIPVDQDVLSNPANYQVDSDCGVKLVKIRPITAADQSATNKKHIGSANYIFVLQAERVPGKQTVTLRLKNQMPAWVAASSSDDDTNLGSAQFATTTFGLKYLLQGIYNAYQNVGTPYLFSLTLQMQS